MEMAVEVKVALGAMLKPKPVPAPVPVMLTDVARTRGCAPLPNVAVIV